MLWWTIRRLRSSRVHVRQAAAKKLAGTKSPRAFDALLSVLNDPNETDSLVKHYVMHALAAIGDRRAAPRLFEIALATNDWCAKSALDVIEPNWRCRIEARALVPRLMLELEHTKTAWHSRPTEMERHVRSQVNKRVALVRELGLFPDSRVIRPLLRELTYSAFGSLTDEVPVAALRALDGMGVRWKHLVTYETVSVRGDIQWGMIASALALEFCERFACLFMATRAHSYVEESSARAPVSQFRDWRVEYYIWAALAALCADSFREENDPSPGEIQFHVQRAKARLNPEEIARADDIVRKRREIAERRILELERDVEARVQQ